MEGKDQDSHTSIAKAAGGKDWECRVHCQREARGLWGMTGSQEEEIPEGNQVTAERDQTLRRVTTG